MKTTMISFALVVSLGVAHAQKGKSLYDELGGIHTIAKAVDLSLTTEMKDPMLLKSKNWATAVAMIGKPAMAFILTSRIASGSGGPQTFPKDIDFFATCRWFGFTPEQQAHAWKIRMDAMTQAGIPVDAQMRVRKWAEDMEMKAKPMAPKMEPLNPGTLYARLGGFVPISMVIDTFVTELEKDPVIGSNPHTVKALSSGRISGQGLRFLVTEQLIAATGGPWTYSGRTMAESHKGLMISEKEWEAGAGILKRVLNMYKVPAKEQGEIFAAISSLHGDIVGK
jgi:hemoglobin